MHGGVQRCVEVHRRVHKGVQRCMEVCRGAWKGVQGGVQAMKGPGWQKKAGPHGCPEVGKWENGCGGHIESTPTIG